MAVLMITHNLRVVNQVADQVLVMYAGRMVESAERRRLLSAPHHPYSKDLLQAIPGTSLRDEPLREIPGKVPPATRFPDHCRFAERCASCFDRCREEMPEPIEVGSGLETACFLYEEGP